MIIFKINRPARIFQVCICLLDNLKKSYSRFFKCSIFFRQDGLGQRWDYPMFLYPTCQTWAGPSLFLKYGSLKSNCCVSLSLSDLVRKEGIVFLSLSQIIRTLDKLSDTIRICNPYILFFSLWKSKSIYMGTFFLH